MSKSLIVSNNSYDWVKHCSGLILSVPKDVYDIVVINKDDDRPIFFCRDDICKSAVYEQRSDDLFRIGKELNIKKIINLGYERDSVDIVRLTTQLSLYLLTGGISRVLSMDVGWLNIILSKICNQTKVEHLLYGVTDYSKFNISLTVVLTEENIFRKAELRKQMVGVNGIMDLPLDTWRELFYKVKK